MKLRARRPDPTAKKRMREYRARRRLLAAVARCVELQLDVKAIVSRAMNRLWELPDGRKRNGSHSYVATHSPARVVLRRVRRGAVFSGKAKP